MSSSKAKSLRFTHVHLENWRNFTRVDLDLQRRVFLVGPNASGKSNFLDVFRFLRDIVAVGGGFQAAAERRGGVSSLRSLAAPRNSDITVGVRIGTDEDPGAWEYELRFNRDKNGSAVVKKEKVAKGGRRELDRPDAEDKKDAARLSQTYLEQVHANQRVRDVADFFASVRYLHIVPQLVREPDRSVGKTNDPFGGDFIEQMAKTPRKTRNAREKLILEALRVAIPQLHSLVLKQDTQGRPHLLAKYKHWRSPGAWHTEEQFSDGTLRLLGLLWASLDGSGPLLLEEPELSLHPGLVRLIPLMLTRAQHRKRRQIMITTHSPELLQDEGIGLNEALLLQPTKGGTSVTPASDSAQIRALLQDGREGGLTLGEAVMPWTSPRDTVQLALWPE